ncbi:MAG TPA: hypothetical protein VFV96_00305 [Verrucomicrobiae bacterium]|nr:hypothetical protein [Verrucomicrobiae bacterium]
MKASLDRMLKHQSNSASESTVIIAGAGASKPYGLPLGRELRDLVLKIRTTDSNLKLLKQFNISQEDFRGFRADLQMSAISTVDSFLEKRPTWMTVGKIAMAMALDGKENEEKLFPPNHPRDHWYESLWQSLNCNSWSALKKKRVRVVTFNYDRTFECYFCGVIANNLRVSRSKAAEWLTEEFVVHPHGTLGKYKGEHLHWMSMERPDQYERIKLASKSIVVISEANTKTAAFSAARSLLKASDNFVFLGFGYHSKNMERLGFPEISDTPKRSIYASSKGVSRYDWSHICKNVFRKPSIERIRWSSLSAIVSNVIS